MKIKRIIFRLQELFRRKPKTKKAEPIFHAIGLFAMDVDAPVFLEVLTGTKIDWNKTVKKWRFYK